MIIIIIIIIIKSFKRLNKRGLRSVIRYKEEGG
jgi:hypothetical protein